MEGEELPRKTADHDTDELVRFVARGQELWPEIPVSREDALVCLRRSLDTRALPPWEHAGDWYLACACTLGVPAALTTFCATFAPMITRIGRRRIGDSQSDDLSQILLERLLLGTLSERPKIGQYQARSSLKTWVAAAAATLASTLRRTSSRRRRHEGRAVEDQRIIFELLADPAQTTFQQRHREHLGQAIREALGTLDDRDKNLLRLHVGRGMTIDQLATLYRVSRATTSRWLIAAREKVASDARARLKSNLALTDTDVSALFALISNVMEISVLRHLG